MRLHETTGGSGQAKGVFFVFFPLALSYGLVLWLMRSSLFQLHDKWTQWDQAYSHGYLLVVVCLYYIFKNLPEKLRPLRYGWIYSLLAIVPSLVWLFGYATQIGAIEQIALPVFLACLVLPVVGLRQFTPLIFPFALLFLAIPLWEVLIPILQAFTVSVSTIGVRLLGIPAYINGTSFSLPYGNVLVAGSCAGLSYFLMAIVLSSINSIHRNYSIKQTVLTVLLMTGLAIVGNWFRVYTLILIAYYSKMTSSLVYEHGMYGWWIFAGTFFLYLWLIRNIPERRKASNAAQNPRSYKLLYLNLVLALVCAVAVPVWFMSGKLQSSYQHRPLAVSGFEQVSPAYANARLRVHFRGYDIEEFVRARVDERLWLIGRKTYVDQTQGKELITEINYIAEHYTKRLTHKLASGQALNVDVVEIRGPKLVVSTYLIGSKSIAQNWQGKLTQFKELLAGRSSNALWYATIACDSYQCNDELASLEGLLAPVDQWLSDSALY
ncbi:exosortase [Reinekea marinisedimentorum]|uniref:Exosortase n=1 Tax=Reinekea marinisedimentorum TaxID=230495 RepID=A0A4R3IER9_9GAMM|nr:exosortase [Reinekea marinisedimentorum]TCS44108.1 exosortase [Reinekea marinisedimentorum]